MSRETGGSLNPRFTVRDRPSVLPVPAFRRTETPEIDETPESGRKRGLARVRAELGPLDRPWSSDPPSTRVGGPFYGSRVGDGSDRGRLLSRIDIAARDYLVGEIGVSQWIRFGRLQGLIEAGAVAGYWPQRMVRRAADAAWNRASPRRIVRMLARARAAPDDP